MSPGTDQGFGHDLIALGRILKPVGLDGEVIVAPLGRTLRDLPIPSEVILTGETGAATAAILTGMREHGTALACRFADHDTRERAEVLRNRMISVGQEKLPTLRAGEFYHFELEGMDVVSIIGEKLVGKVKAVYEYPTTDALEVERPGGSPVMIPLTGGVVQKIDKEKRRILVHESMLEELL